MEIPDLYISATPANNPVRKGQPRLDWQEDLAKLQRQR